MIFDRAGFCGEDLAIRTERRVWLEQPGSVEASQADQAGLIWAAGRRVLCRVRAPGGPRGEKGDREGATHGVGGNSLVSLYRASLENQDRPSGLMGLVSGRISDKPYLQNTPDLEVERRILSAMCLCNTATSTCTI